MGNKFGKIGMAMLEKDKQWVELKEKLLNKLFMNASIEDQKMEEM